MSKHQNLLIITSTSIKINIQYSTRSVPVQPKILIVFCRNFAVFYLVGTNRTTVEVKQVLYCVLNNNVFFIPMVVLTIVQVNTKWQSLAVMLGLVLSFQISAILMPFFSKQLREILFSSTKKPMVMVSFPPRQQAPLVNTITNLEEIQADT